MNNPYQGLVVFAFSLLLASPASAIIVDLHSGNGTIGDTDSAITFLQGPANTGFSTTFTASDFSAADNGAAASIINNHPAWVTPTTFASAGGNADAQWISDNPTGVSEGATALYAIDFYNPFTTLTSATLDFYWAVDNFLGDNFNDAIYINGQAVNATIPGGGFAGVNSSLNIDVANLLNSGNNTLYINSRDIGGPGGLIFSAQFDIDGEVHTVPAPGAALLFLAGLFGLTLRFRTTRDV